MKIILWNYYTASKIPLAARIYINESSTKKIGLAVSSASSEAFQICFGSDPLGLGRLYKISREPVSNLIQDITLRHE